MLDNEKPPAPGQSFGYKAVDFDKLRGWADDDQRAALRAFLVSMEGELGPGRDDMRQALRRTSALARNHADKLLADRAAARAFFEECFRPWSIAGNGAGGFLTGYYEPVLEGSLVQDERFNVPILRRPSDLVQLVDHRLRAAATAAGELTAGRRVGDRLEPYYTRGEIEAGALAGRGLEIAFLEDPVAAFLMHVQGSGRVVLPDGRHLRLGYDGKNGHPYTSIGGLLVSRGILAKSEVNLETLRGWLKAHPVEGRQLMQENRSYIFFAERQAGRSDDGPIGAQGTPLSAERSLAVDASYHVLGTPIFVSAPDLKEAGPDGFHRLLIAQDVGSAIKGPERGDIFWGTGQGAEAIAGRTRHQGRFYVLIPREILLS